MSPCPRMPMQPLVRPGQRGCPLVTDLWPQVRPGHLPGPSSHGLCPQPRPGRPPTGTRSPAQRPQCKCRPRQVRPLGCRGGGCQTPPRARGLWIDVTSYLPNCPPSIQRSGAALPSSRAEYVVAKLDDLVNWARRVSAPTPHPPARSSQNWILSEMTWSGAWEMAQEFCKSLPA